MHCFLNPLRILKTFIIHHLLNGFHARYPFTFTFFFQSSFFTKNLCFFVFVFVFFVDQDKTSNCSCISQMLHLCVLEETAQHPRGVSRTITIILKKFKYIGQVLVVSIKGLQLCMLPYTSSYECKLCIYLYTSYFLNKLYTHDIKEIKICLFFFQWKPFLDGIQSSLVAKKLKHCLEESWPFILQAVSLDAVPVNMDASESSRTADDTSKSVFFSGYNMVELQQQDYQFLWSFSLLVLFQGQHATPDETIIPLDYVKSNFGSDSPVADTHSKAMKFYEIIFPVFGFLSAEKFFQTGFLTIDVCRELLQVIVFWSVFTLYSTFRYLFVGVFALINGAISYLGFLFYNKVELYEYRFFHITSSWRIYWIAMQSQF